MIALTCIGRIPFGLNQRTLQHVLVTVFKKLRKAERGAVAIRFMTEAEIATLNATYRKKRRPTDVLSFAPLHHDPRNPEWGDICICPVIAAREADRRSISRAEELVRLTVHGFLHLLGFDHATELEETRMFALQEEIVERVMS